jgi:Fe-S-cluster-containing hydrogenase component 2
MAVKNPVKKSLWQWLLLGEPQNMAKQNHIDEVKKAVKCDLCRDLETGPACVQACPTGAAIRVNPEAYINLL